MASLYAPHLTRWRVATSDGGELDCVDYEGRPLIFQREEDCRRLFPDDEEDTRECLEIGGKEFPLMEERMAPVWLDGAFGGTVRCVEYVDDDGSVMLLTATKGEEGVVAEVSVVDGEVWVLGCGGHYVDPESGTVEQVVDVQGARQAYALLISVRQEIGRIVRIKRLN